MCDDVMDFLPTDAGKPGDPAPEDQEDGLDLGNALGAFETSERWASDRLPLEANEEPAPAVALADAFKLSDYPNSDEYSEASAAAATPELAPLDISFDAEAASAAVAAQTGGTDSPLAKAVEPAPPAAIAGKQPAGGTPKRMTPRQMAVAGGGVLAAGVLMFTILGIRGAASPEPASAPAPARRPAAAVSVKPKAIGVEARPSAEAPHWSRVADGRWVSTSRHSAAFEVSATSRIHVWTRDVTPVLVVRCDAGRTEAFVYTQSAARMEPQDGDHSVSVAFDDGSTSTERWPDSAEHDALFARNGADFARKLAAARTLRFGFTPHNAEPAVATFAVDGLSELLASSPKQCGVK